MDERILVHVPSIALGGVIRYSQRTIYRLLDRFKSFYRTSTTTIRPFLRQPFFTPPPSILPRTHQSPSSFSLD